MIGYIIYSLATPTTASSPSHIIPDIYPADARGSQAH